MPHRHGGGGFRADTAAQCDDRLDHGSLSSLFQNVGVIRRDGDHRPADRPAGRSRRAGSARSARVAFDRVSHHYGHGAGGLDGVSHALQPGEKVGLVGRSGRANPARQPDAALLRYRGGSDPDRRPGYPRRDPRDSLRRQIGMVTQDPSLLHRSVRANILYGRPDASEAEMVETAEAEPRARLHPGLGDPGGRDRYDAMSASAG